MSAPKNVIRSVDRRILALALILVGAGIGSIRVDRFEANLYDLRIRFAASQRSTLASNSCRSSGLLR